MVMTKRVKKKIVFKFVLFFFFFFLPDSLNILAELNKKKFFIACLKYCVEEFLVDVQCWDVLKGVCVIIA